ncbi:pyrophosphatase PpaX [Sporosarcina sp. 179-K 3D1 HS]|uniref:pyrophosphatase PpaX n=1 Tax=Sporosarcina sp. 179-K 3D1 HS TaxID=3232169 RepID=UPI0039A05675
MAKPITTLLFDFDGTLLDTNELIIASFQHVLNARYPGRFTREDILMFIGPPLIDSFNSIDPDSAEEMVREYREWNHVMHDELAREYDGVSETLKRLKAAGIKMAIVSTKRNETIWRGLKLLEAEEIFDTVVGLDDVTNPKPDPEPIILALSNVGSTKEEALMIGDNSHDIEGGKNARVRTAGVAWSIKGEPFLASLQPDYMLHHLSDLLEIIKGEGA